MPTAPVATRIRLLLVEDDAHDVELTRRKLAQQREAAFDITQVPRLADALPIVQRGGIDAVLLDLSLPDASGMAGLRELALAIPLTPIVVLTGNDHWEASLRALRNGAQEYLQKGRHDAQRLAQAICHAIERKHFEARLIERANFDHLTGLPNRPVFLERLEHAIARNRRAGGRIGVMFIDLDGFKQINDSLGHEAGDQALGLVAQQLRRAVRESEMVARFGGDEFTVLLDPVSHEDAAALVARRLLSAFEEPMPVDATHIRLSLSIGIALFPQHADNAEELLRFADAAMYRAKNTGRSSYTVHA